MELNHQEFIKELESEMLGYHPWMKEQWEEQHKELIQHIDNPENHSKDLFNTFKAPTWDLFLKQIDLVLDKMDKDPNLYGYIYINKDDDIAHSELTNNSELIQYIIEYTDSTSNPRFFIYWG